MAGIFKGTFIFEGRSVARVSIERDRFQDAPPDLATAPLGSMWTKISLPMTATGSKSRRTESGNSSFNSAEGSYLFLSKTKIYLR